MYIDIDHKPSEKLKHCCPFLVQRQYAYLVDVLLWHLFGYGILAWSGLRSYLQHNADGGMYGIYGALMVVGWRILFLFKDGLFGLGCSPGKWVFDLRVVNTDTRAPIGAWQSFYRNLLLIVPLLGELILLLTMSVGFRPFDRVVKCEVISVDDEWE